MLSSPSRLGPITFLVALCACATSPIVPLPPKLPLNDETVKNDATSGGRVQSIAVSPTDRNRALVAGEFGGLWQTFGNGSAWFRVNTLPEVFVSDVEYGADGKTVVAAVQRGNKTANGGGIYVSRTSGDFWARPATGVALGGPTSANSVSHAPDERGLWYVGTSFGVAISRDDGATWSHVPIGPVQSVLAMPGGTVLAMTSTEVQRSDDRGVNWRTVITDDFGWESFTLPPRGGNKMDRSPYAPWAFIFLRYGALWFYELDTGTKTLVPLPQGRWRGPFVRVSKDLEAGGQNIRIWVGQGWDGYYVTRADAGSIRAIRADANWNDWVSFIAPAGIHADLGDLGLDADLQPVLIGSDGGIFKPRPGASGQWMSAAVPSSNLNSLQISDFHGTNVAQSDGSWKTSLYFTTQDNKIWGSPDGGSTWPNSDDQEGFRLEGRAYAGIGEPITVAYVRVGSGYSMRFSGKALTNQRDVSNLNEGGQPLDGHMGPDGTPLDNLEGPFFVYQQAGSGVESSWVRLRWRKGVPGREVYLSMDSGKHWRKVGDLNLEPKGEIKTASGLVSWIPVATTGGRIGLIPLTAVNSYLQNLLPTYDDSDVVLLPGTSGSLGQRATMFDWHAVFGVHPLDWQFLIAPDVAANDVKTSHDGGTTWTTDVALTQEVLRGGELKITDGNAYRMEVTTIAFEPPPPGGLRYLNRIFVGTRDAGIICSADSGRTWRTVKDSDKIKYITGFHFRQDGAVYVSSYGHGLYYVKPSPGCPEAYSFPWDQKKPAPPIAGTTSALGASAVGQRMPPPPRGIPDRDSPRLYLAGSGPGTGVAIVGSDGILNVTGRGFSPGAAVALRSRGRPFLDQKVSADKRGVFSLTVRVPDDLPFDVSAIEAAVPGARSPISAEFVRALTDEDERNRAGEQK